MLNEACSSFLGPGARLTDDTHVGERIPREREGVPAHVVRLGSPRYNSSQGGRQARASTLLDRLDQATLAKAFRDELLANGTTTYHE